MLRSLERFLKTGLVYVLRLLLGSKRTEPPVPSEISRILVIRQHNQLGDMLCVVPLLRSLRDRFPTAIISLMASPVSYEIMKNNLYVNEVINYDKEEFLADGWLRPVKIIQFIRKLRRARYDLVIVPSTVSLSFTSDLLAYLSRGRYRMGAESLSGESNPSGFLFNVRVALDWRETPDRHQTLRNLDIASPLMLASDDLSIEMTLTEDELNRGKKFLKGKLPRHGLIVGLHPGAGKPPNRWPARNFAKVANALAREKGAYIVITSGPMDTRPVEDMTLYLEVPFQLMERSPIRTVASVLKHVDLVISNDTGIMHVSAAVGTPVLSLFGPTSASQWAPIGAKHRCIAAGDGNISSIAVSEVVRNAKEMLLNAKIPNL